MQTPVKLIVVVLALVLCLVSSFGVNAPHCDLFKLGVSLLILSTLINI